LYRFKNYPATQIRRCYQANGKIVFPFISPSAITNSAGTRFPYLASGSTGPDDYPHARLSLTR